MKKQQIIYLVVGIVILLITAGGWYSYKYRECVKKVSYVPQREQGEITGGGYSGSGLRRVVGHPDKGDYYSFDFGLHKFKISEDAIRACMWK